MVHVIHFILCHTKYAHLVFSDSTWGKIGYFVRNISFLMVYGLKSAHNFRRKNPELAADIDNEMHRTETRADKINSKERCNKSQ